MRTLTASRGAKPISARNSADALAAKYKVVRHKYAFSLFIQIKKNLNNIFLFYSFNF